MDLEGCFSTILYLRELYLPLTVIFPLSETCILDDMIIGHNVLSIPKKATASPLLDILERSKESIPAVAEGLVLRNLPNEA